MTFDLCNFTYVCILQKVFFRSGCSNYESLERKIKHTLIVFSMDFETFDACVRFVAFTLYEVSVLDIQNCKHFYSLRRVALSQWQDVGFTIERS